MQDMRTPDLSLSMPLKYTASPSPTTRPSLDSPMNASPMLHSKSFADEGTRSSVDDWGLDEVSGSEDGTEAATVHQSHRDMESTDSIFAGRANSERTPAVNSMRSTDSVRNTSHRDTITLRAFDESVDPKATLVASDLANVSNVIGMYADPAAARDDWGDDFDLEEVSSKRDGSSESRAGDEGPASAPSWFVEKDIGRVSFELKEITETVPLGGTLRSAYNPATAEVLLGSDDSLRMRGVPESAFATPNLSYSSLLTFPGIGYKASIVHPSCTRVKELFSRYQRTIRRHFDALVRDSGGTIALDEQTREVYKFSGDEDVARVAKQNTDLAADMLTWKLEWAIINRNVIDHARYLLTLSKIFKGSANFKEALRLIREALLAVSTAEESNMAIAIAAELEYEHAILNRALGALGDCDQSLRQAMALGAKLASRSEESDDLLGPQQRGLWWQLRCKYLLAELAFDLSNMDAAVQFFSEYVVESVTRMVGLIAPPRSEDAILGAEFMRYCLFSPRRLVLALWNTLICLGELRCFAAAADMAGLTCFVASSFGYEDVNNAASVIRVRVREIVVELRQQYDDITKDILNDSNSVSEGVGNLSNRNSLGQIPISKFGYDDDDLGDIGNNIEEDWDAQLQKELNIKIERCCDADQSVDVCSHDADGNPLPSSPANEAHIPPLPNSYSGQDLRGSFGGKDDASMHKMNMRQTSLRWETGSRKGNLTEVELRQYLGRVGGAASNLSAQHMFPKPTQPFDGRPMGPREHENFLRRFVRSKDPVSSRRILHGLPVSPQWEPSSVCKLKLDFNELLHVTVSELGRDVMAEGWGLRVLDIIWKIVRSEGELSRKRLKVRQLILDSFSRFSTAVKRTPAHTESERELRVNTIAALLDSLRVARDIVTENGSEAGWFCRASMVLGMAAKAVTPAAKAAVELFQAESRAHCGLRAVVSKALLDRCVRASNKSGIEVRDEMGENSSLSSPSPSKQPDIPPPLCQTVVDVLHALYWRTKASFDESSDIDSLERLLHAEVAATLFLTGSGVSPVDGSSIDLTVEPSILSNAEKKKAKSDDSKTFVDETRRVSASELVNELQSLWSVLPSSGGLIRAKVSYALALHSRVERRNYSRAERFLFDGLRSIHFISTAQGYPHTFFSSLLYVCPVSVVSAPLAEAILQAYGTLAVSHSKYRYGLAALEAATDACKVRCMSGQVYRSALSSVIDVALDNSDWRRALVLLYNLRTFVHPKDGLRNEFLHSCLKLHRICFNVGCFEASIVPLRAYSALIYEERLRVLLQRYRRRLAKKARSRFRRHFPSSPLPKILSGSSVFPTGRNTLAPFFEVPVVTGTHDSPIIRSTVRFEERARSSKAVVPISTASDGSSALRRLTALLWPLTISLYPSVRPLAKIQESNVTTPASSKAEGLGTEAPKSPSKSEAKAGAAKSVIVAGAGYEDADRYKEEQRELLRIEAEQEVVADCDRYRVELLRAQTEYAMSDFPAAEERCRGLLDMKIPHAGRFKVLEILARIRLKRREITRCLELIEQMENEHKFAEEARDTVSKVEVQPVSEHQRVSLFRLHDPNENDKNDKKPPLFVPQVTFLRVTALIHGGRLNEALHTADEAVGLCDEHAFWNLGRLYHLRGKALFAMSSSTTAPIDKLDQIEKGATESTQMDLKVTELTMVAFETASRFYDAAGDEVCAAKSDLQWARTCIDLLFRRVVLKASCGGGMSLREACLILDKRIVVDDVVDTIHGVITIAQTANIPLLLIDAMAALAEIKCIQKQPASSWLFWVSEAWKLFSRLFTNGEDFTVVLSALAPVSTLFRLRNICGRLVRVVMCEEQGSHVSEMNKHLRLFEAYVTLQISIERKMNLASSAHSQESFSTLEGEEAESETLAQESLRTESKHEFSTEDVKKGGIKSAGIGKRRRSKVEKGNMNAPRDALPERVSEMVSQKSAPRRPAGAFLHILSNEGVALGRQGFSVFINRPRQQVISAVKETGAVLIPTNFFSNSKAAPGHELGRDAEMIFPFKPSVGLGAMQILDDIGIHEMRNITDHTQPGEYKTVVELPKASAHAGSVHAEPVLAVNASEMSKGDIERDEEQFLDARKSTAEPHDSTGSARQTFISARDDTAQADHVHSSKNSKTTELEREENVSMSQESPRNELVELVKVVREEVEGGNILTKGSSSIFGKTVSERVWSHLQRIKMETKRYMHGKISFAQLADRNSDALLGWMHCIPLYRKEWSVPESIGRRLVYVLYAHGVVGYYSVERGGSIERIAFGGKQCREDERSRNHYASSGVQFSKNDNIRSLTRSERMYLSELVKGFKRDEVWHKNRDSEIVNGLANCVLKAPRLLLSLSTPAHKSRSRPIVLIADLSLQIIPWELFFDHVVIRSHCLLDVIRGLQEEFTTCSESVKGSEDPTVAANRKVARFISFGPSRRETIDLERTEEARRQQLAFQGLLRLNHMSATSLTAFLGLGGFSDPTALNAVARPTGPLSSPLSQSRRAVKLLGLRISANIGRRNYPHVDFLRVAGLGSATMWDLKEAAMIWQPIFNDKDEPRRDLGAYLPVFMFSYADLVDSSDSVFGLRKLVPDGILMFTPAIHMKVLARHLEDDELSVELGRASGRMQNRIFPDVTASARVLVEYVSRFSRDKRIPIVVFLGQRLVDVFPRKRSARVGGGGGGRKERPAAERLAQLAGGRGVAGMFAAQ